jgi:plastin-1
MLLGVTWQLARLVAVQKIALKNCPEIYRLLKDGEELSDLMKLPAEDILVRWINYHLRKAGQTRQVTNLGKDLQDSFAIYHVLNQLDKQHCPLTHINDENLTDRANNMIKNSSAIGVPALVSADDWNKGNSRVNTVYVAEIFNTRHGLEELTQQEQDDFEKAGIIDDDIAGTREERQFRLWINSLEIEGVYVNNLYEDVRDGQVLLKVIHKINPNVVEWNRVEKNPDNTFKKGINCQVAFDACGKLGVKLIGIGATDIQQGNKKLVLAIVWQLMRIHYLQIIGTKSEQDLINWANSCKGNESRQIKNLKDANLGDGVFLINLTSAIEPRIVDWSLVTMACENDEQKTMNAKYAISIARKLGAVIFLVWEDVLELNQKMMLIFIASLYELHQESGK